MASPHPAVALFAEDAAHEKFVSALVKKVGFEMGIAPRVQVSSARGGHGRALAELALYQKIRAAGGARTAAPIDVLVVAIDANCAGWNRARTEIAGKIDGRFFPTHAIACPDPHIERWFLADPRALNHALGASATVTERKCDRGEYKRALAETLRGAGHVLALGGIEFAEEIVTAMDLYAAGKNEPSLKHFIDDLRAAFRARNS
jgi:hypothetical protein